MEGINMDKDESRACCKRKGGWLSRRRARSPGREGPPPNGVPGRRPAHQRAMDDLARLVEQSRSGSTSVRMRAVQALGEIHCPEALAALCGALDTGYGPLSDAAA